MTNTVFQPATALFLLVQAQRHPTAEIVMTHQGTFPAMCGRKSKYAILCVLCALCSCGKPACCLTPVGALTGLFWSYS